MVSKKAIKIKIWNKFKQFKRFWNELCKCLVRPDTAEGYSPSQDLEILECGKLEKSFVFNNNKFEVSFNFEVLPCFYSKIIQT